MLWAAHLAMPICIPIRRSLPLAPFTKKTFRNEEKNHFGGIVNSQRKPHQLAVKFKSKFKVVPQGSGKLCELQQLWRQLSRVLNLSLTLSWETGSGVASHCPARPANCNQSAAIIRRTPWGFNRDLIKASL